MKVDQSIFDFIVNHVFLPPKLPNQDDENVFQKEMGLLRLVQDVADQFVSQVPDEFSAKWQSIVSMLRVWENITEFGRIDKERLSMSLKNLEPGGMS